MLNSDPVGTIASSLHEGHYRLQTYLIVDSREKFIQGFHLCENDWEERIYQEQDEISLDCLEMMLSVEDVYRGFEL